MAKGINRIGWDLHYPLPMLLPPPAPESDDEPDTGPLVMPGKYTVTLAKRVDGVVTQLGGPQAFDVIVPGQTSMLVADRKELAEFQQKVALLQRAVYGALQTTNDVKTRLGTIKRALQETAAPVDSLLRGALAVEMKVNDILRALRGDVTLRSRNENSPPSINERVTRIIDDQRLSTSRPTQTQRDGYIIASNDFKGELAKLKTLVGTDLALIEKQMETAGAPWTPGRIPVWEEQ
jgi:hypothetical protein